MYRPNKRHLQPLLVRNVNALPITKRQRLEQSWAQTFYREFFCRIDEEAFAILYVDHTSRERAHQHTGKIGNTQSGIWLKR